MSAFFKNSDSSGSCARGVQTRFPPCSAPLCGRGRASPVCMAGTSALPLAFCFREYLSGSVSSRSLVLILLLIGAFAGDMRVRSSRGRLWRVRLTSAARTGHAAPGSRHAGGVVSDGTPTARPVCGRCRCFCPFRFLEEMHPAWGRQHPGSGVRATRAPGGLSVGGGSHGKPP